MKVRDMKELFHSGNASRRGQSVWNSEARQFPLCSPPRNRQNRRACKLP